VYLNVYIIGILTRIEEMVQCVQLEVLEVEITVTRTLWILGVAGSL